jgi:hypothetical protein
MTYKDPEKQREYTKRYNAAHREKQLKYHKQWVKTNREHVREYNRRYYAEHNVAMSAAWQEWRKANPEKHAAHNAVRRALEVGQLVKPTTCSECGGTDRIEGHHEDYSKPLEVEWLCYECHQKKKEA